MNTADAVTVAVVIGSLAAVVAEIALKDPGAFREIANDSAAFARRQTSETVTRPARRAASVAATTALAVLLVLLV
jgi:hypothetical protein